jgi:hypothetical protein
MFAFAVNCLTVIFYIPLQSDFFNNLKKLPQLYITRELYHFRTTIKDLFSALDAAKCFIFYRLKALASIRQRKKLSRGFSIKSS